MSKNVTQKQRPAYLNDNCLEKALKIAFGQNGIKILNSEWQFADVPGGHYGSDFYEIQGSYEFRSTKSANEQQQFNFNVQIIDIYIGTNEVIMLEKILPELSKIFGSQKIVEHTKTTNKLTASCFLSQAIKNHEFFIFEDLNALGYSLQKPRGSLRIEAAELVMEKLAKFHAASIIYAQKHPDIIKSLKPAKFAFDAAVDPFGYASTKKSMECTIKILENFDKEIIEKIKIFNTKYDKKIKEVVNPAKSAFNVLNHGDLWTNNILFKTEEAQGDAIFVDFQDVFWGSPACDLNYFFYSSLSLKNLQTQRFKLLALYYKTLKATLEALNYKNIPNWCVLLKEIRRCSLIAYYAAICEFPFIAMSEKAAKDYTAEIFLESPTKWMEIYKTPKVNEFLEYTMLYFTENGLFDE